MLTSTITLIVLRLFCFQWLLEGLTMVFSAAFGVAPGSRDYLAVRLTPGIVMILISVVVWLAAPFLARLVAGKADASVTVPVPPLRDLYAFAFVLVGLYFVVTSLGEVLVWFHYSLITTVPNVLYPERDRFVSSLITLAAGAICIIFGKYWAGKLSEDKPTESQPPAAL